MLHETYSKGEANYEFCIQLCKSKGGVNCGGKRVGINYYFIKDVVKLVIVREIQFMDSMNVIKDSHKN